MLGVGLLGNQAMVWAFDFLLYPFIAVAYLRPGSYHFNGLTRREWRLFWVSVLIGNLFWSFVAFTGITVFRWAWEQLTA